MDLLYNSLLLATDVAVVFFARRSATPRAHALGIFLACLSGVLLAVLFQRDGFHLFRLHAWVCFLHLPVLLLAAAGFLRREHRRSAAAHAALAMLILLVALDAFLVEPHWLEVTQLRFETDELRRSVRVAVVADLQTDRIGAYERRVLTRVMDGRPDLILLTGDYIHQNHRTRRKAVEQDLRALLSETGFSAPLGVYAVRGNVEHNDWPGIFEGTAVTPLPQTASRDLGPLRLSGLDLLDSFDPALSVPPDDRFHLIFGHAPDFALGDVRADLLVAGHTHGGQVRLPLLGPLLTFSRVPGSWAAGVTRLEQGGWLVVSRGIGMERGNAPRLRLFCRPEIVFIECAPPPPN